MKNPNKIQKIENISELYCKNKITVLEYKINELIEAVNEIYSRFEKAKIELDKLYFPIIKKQRSSKNV